MKNCVKCPSDRLITVDSFSDDHNIFVENKKFNFIGGSLLPTIGLGDDNDLHMTFCLNCGQIQGNWPLPITQVELGMHSQRCQDEEKDWFRANELMNRATLIKLQPAFEYQDPLLLMNLVQTYLHQTIKVQLIPFEDGEDTSSYFTWGPFYCLFV